MKVNNRILTYDEIKGVKDGKSKERLLDVRYYDSSITARYEKFDMTPYAGFKILLRETVARKLAAVNKRLKNKYDLRLRVVYGYRALEVQTNYFNKMRIKLKAENPTLSAGRLTRFTHNFVAVPEVAGHITGGAVDITLTNSDGVVCDMGTKIADYSDKDRIKTYTTKITVDQQRLRQILLDEMTAEGFAPFLGEWWHFSYGDKEWAAYYKKPKSLYNPIDMEMTAKSIRIAGGNETAIQLIEGRKAESHAQAGKALLDAFPNAEQAGLLYVDSKQLEMAGGEFCGNASAAVATLLAKESGESTVKYRVSGFNGDVVADVVLTGKDKYRVRTVFNNMCYNVESLQYNKVLIKIVDMDGIIHVLIEGAFPASNYVFLQRQLISDLGLGQREAVGVIWYEQKDEKVKINPVVWVKSVDTLYYESACGSGAIAAALATGGRKIQQPTGEYIDVYVDKDGVITECDVVSVADRK